MAIIQGDKPNGNFVTYTGDGIKIEGETRQCAHCQFIWEYKPGSGNRRGLCLSCNGLICAQPWCKEEQAKRMQHVRVYHPNLANINCIRFADWNDLLGEEQMAIRGAKMIEGTNSITFKDADLESLEVTPSGILIKK